MNPKDINLQSFSVIRRDGSVVAFEPDKIRVAVAKAFIFDHHGKEWIDGKRELSDSEHILVAQVLQDVVAAVTKRKLGGGSIHIEDIQDQVELHLMRTDQHKVARSFVLYREARLQVRAAASDGDENAGVTLHDGTVVAWKKIEEEIAALSGDLLDVEPGKIVSSVKRDVYNGMNLAEWGKALILSARQMIELEPGYSQLAARLLLKLTWMELPKELGESLDYSAYFPEYIKAAVDAERLDKRLLAFDLARLTQAIDGRRDNRLDYLGLQTLHDRYLVHIDGVRVELPQALFMRVAMGLALNENDPNGKAIEFYTVMSKFLFMPSTPTLFNAGTRHSQLSSCYLTTVGDDLDEIFGAIKDNALLSKWAGGLGNDWTPVRAMGSWIKGTNGKSQGIIPFLKVANDTAIAVNQGGKRKGALCSYLETWHLDIEEFLELRKNTGDDRRRTHDMNTANWLPDLFMKRVIAQQDWTLFSPSEASELHDTYGAAFEEKYVRYEQLADSGQIKVFKRIPAVQLWRKMLTMLFETGHPWITFKDPSNVRSPQHHVGVVHSSNLCTEITLNTSADEIAVCNLGSVSLPHHLRNSGGTDSGWEIDTEMLRSTISTAMRMLDNVIDINYYPVKKAALSNKRYRPVGLGIMGFQDCLQMLGIAYASNAAVTFADRSMEQVAYWAYHASTDLSEERGAYATFNGSLWDRGILPHETLALLREQRGGHVEVDVSETMDWEVLRQRIAKVGMRNSNCLAIAPTATIANIVGVSASIEPSYQNLFVKSNLSGEFTVINQHLVRELKKLKVWDAVTIADLKYFDGSVAKIERVPKALRDVFATAFEIAPEWLIEAAARRQKWIDQAQLLNLYVSQPSGSRLDAMYRLAWTRGLKTTYYLRTLAATAAEKSTGNGGELNAVSLVTPDGARVCPIDDPTCEACQ